MKLVYEPNGVYSAILNGRIVGVGWTEADALADATKSQGDNHE